MPLTPPPFRPLGAPWLLAACLACAPAVQADEPLSTDRPDFVESSDVMDAGRWQVETGLQSERSRSGGQDLRTTTAPLLLRHGMGHALELRLETDGAVRTRSTDAATGATQNERGYADLSLGVKWRMRDGDEARATPAIAWLAQVDVDSGSRAFRGRGARPSLRVVAEWELPQDVSVGVMPGLLYEKDGDGHRFTSGLLAVSVSKALAPRWHGFVELAGEDLGAKPRRDPVQFFDTGLTWLLTDSLQLDASVSRGLSPAAPDLAWGVGLSVRF